MSVPEESHLFSEGRGGVDHPRNPPKSQVLHFVVEFFPKEFARHLLFLRGRSFLHLGVQFVLIVWSGPSRRQIILQRSVDQ